MKIIKYEDYEYFNFILSKKDISILTWLLNIKITNNYLAIFTKLLKKFNYSVLKA